LAARAYSTSSFTIVDTTPSVRDLYQYFTPQYATRWKIIGALLGLPSERLNIIEHDHMFQAECCCNVMLERWLQVNTTASWRKLFTVIESLAVFSVPAADKGD